jgi:hypothetical protein
MLPDAAKKKFNLHWRPIFEMMASAPGLEIRTDPALCDPEYLNSSLESAKKYLKTRVSYVFNRPRAQPLNWEVSTWSMHVQRSMILKKGTQEDKAKLGNNQTVQARVQSRPRRKPLADKRRVRRRIHPPAAEENEIALVAPVNIVENDQGNDEESEEEEAPQLNNTRDNVRLPDFTDANFPNELNARARERGRQIEEALRNEDPAESE